MIQVLEDALRKIEEQEAKIAALQAVVEAVRVWRHSRKMLEAALEAYEEVSYAGES